MGNSLDPRYNNLGVEGGGFTATSLAFNTTYYIRVRAVNAGGTSANSTTVSATPRV